MFSQGRQAKKNPTARNPHFNVKSTFHGDLNIHNVI